MLFFFFVFLNPLIFVFKSLYRLGRCRTSFWAGRCGSLLSGRCAGFLQAGAGVFSGRCVSFLFFFLVGAGFSGRCVFFVGCVQESCQVGAGIVAGR